MKQLSTSLPFVRRKSSPITLLVLFTVLTVAKSLALNQSRRTVLNSAVISATTALSPFSPLPPAVANALPLVTDSSENVSIRSVPRGDSVARIPMPYIGLGLYKTTPEQTAESARLAIEEGGVRLFDTASAYNNEKELGSVLHQFMVDKKLKRRDVFVSSKLSNAEQGSYRTVRKALKKSLSNLKLPYVDLYSIHSPLTTPALRLETWSALQELQKEGLCKSIGVANYGVKHLAEIKNAGLTIPSVNQLEVSPFNLHKDVVAWANENDMVVACAAWSKLSGKYNWGSTENFRNLNDIANRHGGTKAQLLVRWAVQNGFVCFPRSGVTSALERKALGENGPRESQRFGMLTSEEMDILNGMESDPPLSAGSLGRTDGWSESDITGYEWDPTLY